MIVKAGFNIIAMKKNIKKIIFLSFLFFVQNILSSYDYNGLLNGYSKKRKIKVLVLIIASDDTPVYRELQTIWRSYMHNYPEHVEAYFLKSNPDLPSKCEIDRDIIWSRSSENLVPGIINKTIISMKMLLPRIKKEFDYVLRTNLSSFYVFPKLLHFLKSCPKKGFYCGANIKPNSNIGSGCGFLLSSDLVKVLVKNKQLFLNNRWKPDDVLIGKFLTAKRVQLLLQKRMDFLTLEQWHDTKNSIEDDVFQFRIKNQQHLRLTDDIYIQSQLLKKFYL